MKILWYWPHPHRSENPVASELVKRGYDLVVQAQRSSAGQPLTNPSCGYDLKRELPELGVIRGHRFASRILRKAQLLQRQCRRTVRIVRSSPDVVHFQLLEFQIDWITIRLVRLMTGAKLVGVVHDVRPHDSRLPVRFETLLLTLLYRDDCLHHLLVFHSAMRNELINDFGVRPNRITVVPHPVALETKAGNPPVHGPLQVLFLGTLRENKGLDVLISAICGSAPTDRVRYVIAGSGSAHLENVVNGLAELRSDVFAEVGRYSEDRKKQLLNDSQLVVLPYTTFHSQSGVLADSYAHGVPLLVTDVGAIGPTIREDGSGWVVPPNDSAALRVAISQILDDPEDYELKQERVGRAGLSHSPRHVVDGLEIAYSLTGSGE